MVLAASVLGPCQLERAVHGFVVVLISLNLVVGFAAFTMSLVA